MVHQPADVTEAIVEEVRTELAKSKDLPALNSVRLGSYEEGRAMQLLHLGAFSEEGPAIEVLHAAIAEAGGSLVDPVRPNRHHEST